MNFIIIIKDASGHILSEKEEKAEPKFVPLADSYAFRFNAFYLMLNRETYNKLGEDNQ